MQRPAAKRAPLSADEYALINRAARKFRLNQLSAIATVAHDIDDLHEIDYDTNDFAADLKDLILKPELFDVIETGKILAELGNADRLLLLKYRPYIVHDCYDLIVLLRYHIPVESRTLLACALAELMYREDHEYILRNIQVVKKLLPECDQHNYELFCLKVMRELDKPAIHREAARSAKYFTSALILSVLGQCASHTLAPYTRKVSAIGAVYLILKGTIRLSEKIGFWRQIAANEIDTPESSPSDSFMRNVK
jgi:hypothetical protein